MRILLVNHGTAGDWGGGDGVQIRETAKRLALRGHHVEAVNTDQPRAEGFDLVHLFNCRVERSFRQQMASCRQANVPVVVSPIWISLAKALWGSRGTMSVLQQAMDGAPATTVASLLNKLQNRKLVVHMPSGPVNAEGYGEESWPIDKSVIKELLLQADGLLPNSWLELQALRNDLQWHGETFEVAHYGVDPGLFLDPDPEAFRKATGIHTPFVMQAGRIEPAKNQAMLCWALRNTSLPIVLIGGSKHWPAYADLCKRSPERLHIIDHLPQPILASAYAAAAVHVLPSFWKHVSCESRSSPSWCAISGSTFGHELEYLEGDAWYADPETKTAYEKQW